MTSLSSSGVSVESLSFSYGRKRALDNVSLRIEPGRFCALLGPNGAGKSTLLSLMTLLCAADSGRMEIGGIDIALRPLEALSRMGVVFQQTALDLDLTVLQNLKYHAALHGIPRREARPRIEAALALLDIADRSQERCRELNGGHRRRAEIARALLHDPSFLILDEPTVGLDAATRASLVRHVHDLCAEKGLTVLWATHLTDEVWPEDQLALLHLGRMAAVGTARDLHGDVPIRDWFLARTDPDPEVLA